MALVWSAAAKVRARTSARRGRGERGGRTVVPGSPLIKSPEVGAADRAETSAVERVRIRSVFARGGVRTRSGLARRWPSPFGRIGSHRTRRSRADQTGLVRVYERLSDRSRTGRARGRHVDHLSECAAAAPLAPGALTNAVRPPVDPKLVANLKDKNYEARKRSALALEAQGPSPPQRDRARTSDRPRNQTQSRSSSRWTTSPSCTASSSTSPRSRRRATMRSRARAPSWALLRPREWARTGGWKRELMLRGRTHPGSHWGRASRSTSADSSRRSWSASTTRTARCATLPARACTTSCVPFLSTPSWDFAANEKQIGRAHV